MKRKPTSWLSIVKEHWWLVGVVIAVSSGITFLVTAPKRLDALESSDRTQQTTLDRITVLLEQSAKQDAEPQGPPWYDTDNHSVRRICHAEEYAECWRSQLWQRVK